MNFSVLVRIINKFTIIASKTCKKLSSLTKKNCMNIIVLDHHPPKFWLKINQDKPFHTCMMIMMLNRKSERPSAPFFREKGEKRVNIQMRIVIGIGFPS